MTIYLRFTDFFNRRRIFELFLKLIFMQQLDELFINKDLFDNLSFDSSDI